MTSNAMWVVIAGVAVLAMLLSGCGSKGRVNYQQGLVHFQAQQYQDALTKFDEAQAAEPESKVVQFYRSRTLYELDRFQEALDGLEQFLVMTDASEHRYTYDDDRDKADFYILKCKQELGIPIEQSEDDIPEERMRY